MNEIKRVSELKCEVCDSKNVYTTLVYVICRKCGYHKKLKEEKCKNK